MTLYYTIASAPVTPRDTIWSKRQYEQEKKREALSELIPQTQEDEEAMIQQAIALSRQTAQQDIWKPREPKVSASQPVTQDTQYQRYSSFLRHRFSVLQLCKWMCLKN